MTIAVRNTIKLAFLFSLLICVQMAVAKDACSLLTNDEMSSLVGVKFVDSKPSGANEQASITSCVYVTGAAPDVPSALVLLGESDRMRAALDRACGGLEQVDGLGDHACMESDEHVTTLAAAKGGTVVMIVLFSQSGVSGPVETKSAIRKVAQKALTRLM